MAAVSASLFNVRSFFPSAHEMELPLDTITGLTNLLRSDKDDSDSEDEVSATPRIQILENHLRDIGVT